MQTLATGAMAKLRDVLKIAVTVKWKLFERPCERFPQPEPEETSSHRASAHLFSITKCFYCTAVGTEITEVFVSPPPRDS